MLLELLILIIIVIIMCGKRRVTGGGAKTWTKTCQEPWWSLIKSGRKKIEGRLNRGNVKEMQDGDTLVLIEPKTKGRLSGTITAIKVYPTFAKYLETEGVENCLPGIGTIGEGVTIYRQWSTAEEEKEFGVAAIHLSV
jgi:ASC-1-like (ASCH) protein